MARLRTLTLLFALALVQGAEAGTPPVPDRCVFESPCVWVTPDVRVGYRDPPPGTVLTFYGRGWRPGSKAVANYGSFCDPRGVVCGGVGLRSTFRVDAAGQFVFRFRYGRRSPPGPGPKGAGSEEVDFSGVDRSGRDVYQLRAAPPPPPSTPEERREAQRVGAATRDLVRAIARARPRTHRASDAYDREIGRCQPLLRISRPVRRARVIDKVLDAEADASTFGVAAPEFRAYARRLERIAPRDPVLADGVAAWIEAIRTRRHVPRPSLCQELRRWRATGFARAAEPVPPSAAGIDEQVYASEAIRRAGRRLRGLGVSRYDQDRFEGGVFSLADYIL